MTVSMVPALSGHAGFRISKTVRCLWHTLYVGPIQRRNLWWCQPGSAATCVDCV